MRASTPTPAGPLQVSGADAPSGAAVDVDASDGRRLAGTFFRAPSPVGSVLIASAMGVPQRLYAGLAQTFAEQGLSTLTFDYRGIAASRREPSLRGLTVTLVDWARLDLAAGFSALRRLTGDDRPRYFAHSLGGQLLGFLDEPPVQAALFVGSQSGHWREWTGWRRAAMWSVWHLVIPGLVPALGYLPMKALGQGEDVPAGVAREWARWGRHPEYLMLGVRQHGARGFAAFAGPLRSVAITDDGYAPPGSVETLRRRYTGALGQSELVCVSPPELGVKSIGHFGCFRRSFRDSLWKPWARWLLQPRV